MTLPFYVHQATDKGLARDHNEDAVAVLALGGARQFLVVCDGMGGQEAGGVASAVALESITQAVQSSSPPWPKALYSAFTRAQADVVATALDRKTPSMGTTAVCALLEGTHAWLGWIGDSRVYVYRQGQVVALTFVHRSFYGMRIGGGIKSTAGTDVAPTPAQ